MSDAILVLNAGSSSIKFAVFPGRRAAEPAGLVCEGECEGIGHQARILRRRTAPARRWSTRHLADGATHEDALAALLRWLAGRFGDQRLVAAGHRVVHGGPRYAAPGPHRRSVIAELTPAHPAGAAPPAAQSRRHRALSQLHPALPQVACFDTAFHRRSRRSPPPSRCRASLTDEGVRRYGFHGLSYEYIASVLPDVIGPEAADGRVVVAHLGSGASMCAMRARRSVATTMGFTALDGLPMGRRCGALDPGVVLYLIQEKGMTGRRR